MELEELRKAWAEQEERLNRNWRLNIELLRTVNLDKAKSKMTSLTWVIALNTVFFWIMTFLHIGFAIRHWGSLHLSLSGIILAVWSGLVLTGTIQQLQLISRINYQDPIPELQKKLAQLRLMILKYLRLALWAFPFYLAFLIFWAKLLFDFDIVSVAHPRWLWAQFILSGVFALGMLWADRKLRPRHIDARWVKVLLRGNGSQIIDALNFIRQIEQFEQEEKTAP